MVDKRCTSSILVKFHSAKCFVGTILFSVILLSAVLPNVILLNIVLLSVSFVIVTILETFCLM